MERRKIQINQSPLHHLCNRLQYNESIHIPEHNSQINGKIINVEKK